MKTRIGIILAAAAFCLNGTARADITVQMNSVDQSGIGPVIGQIVISETPSGAGFSPSLNGLPPGLHGFHVHENPSCAAREKDGKMVAGLAAGGHFDPAGSKQHGLPWGNGHLGDLPALYVDAGGNATYPLLAPRLKIADLKGRSLMIHVGADNHADHPAPLGGGGARMACGVIK